MTSVTKMQEVNLLGLAEVVFNRNFFLKYHIYKRESSEENPRAFSQLREKGKGISNNTIKEKKMKKLYKQLMKTSALICLLILGTGNVWGAKTWTGGSTSPGTYSSTYKQIGSTTVYLKGNGNNISYDTSIMGFKIKFKTYVYLSARNTDGIVTITLQGAGSLSNNDVTISESTTGFSVVEHVVTKNSTAGAGTSITFEMKKDLDYSIYSSQQLFIKKVVFNVEGTDFIVLDETESKSNNESLINSAKATNSDMKMLKLVRTLKAGQWNTFCLPVTINSVTAPTFSTQLKCEAAYELADYDNSNHTITFSPIKATNSGANIYRANTPCLIKPSEDIVNPIILGGGAIQEVSNLTVTKGDITFTGVYGAENIYTTGDDNSTKFYLNNDGYLVYPTSNEGNKGMIKGLRAYFEWAGGGSVSVKDMTFVFDDSEITGIKTIEHDIFGENGRVYSIDGRYMGDSTDNLSRGIYIQNGRKFVVK